MVVDPERYVVISPVAVIPVVLMVPTVMFGVPVKPPAVVAVPALVALPLNVAVIVPALKLPEASRATTFEAVLADVASTVHVCAAEPL